MASRRLEDVAAPVSKPNTLSAPSLSTPNLASDDSGLRCGLLCQCHLSCVATVFPSPCVPWLEPSLLLQSVPRVFDHPLDQLRVPSPLPPWKSCGPRGMGTGMAARAGPSRASAHLRLLMLWLLMTCCHSRVRIPCHNGIDPCLWLYPCHLLGVLRR